MKSNTSFLSESVRFSALLLFSVVAALLVHELYPIYGFLLFYYLLGGARTIQFGIRKGGFVNSAGELIDRPSLFQAGKTLLIWPLVLWVWLVMWKD